MPVFLVVDARAFAKALADMYSREESGMKFSVHSDLGTAVIWIQDGKDRQRFERYLEVHDQLYARVPRGGLADHGIPGWTAADAFVAEALAA